MIVDKHPLSAIIVLYFDALLLPTIITIIIIIIIFIFPKYKMLDQEKSDGGSIFWNKNHFKLSDISLSTALTQKKENKIN